MAGSANIVGTQHYVLGIGHPVFNAPTEASPDAIYTPELLTGSRSSTVLDSGLVFANASASNFTLTIEANTITQPLQLQQESTGTITLVAGAGVTFIGATLATSGQGGLITLLPTSTANTYIVKVSA